MDKSPLARMGEYLRAASRWFLVRFALFVGAILLAHQLPERAKGAVWIVAFGTGIWAFVALVRESRAACDFLLPRLDGAWNRLGVWMGRRAAAWRLLGLAGGVALAGVAIYQAWPAWQFLATSSLREDEILNIDRYTSRGFAPAVGTYNLARNHIFFNVVSSLVPGADSTSPLRGRLVSLLSVVGSLGLLVLYGTRRGWGLAAVACAGLVAVDLYALKVLLEGRGYGMICLFGTISCIALAEWLRTRRQGWLTLLAVACVFGTYTLPYFVVFGGGLLLVAFFHRPSRDTLLAGFLSLAAIVLLYLPVVDKVLKVASGYDDEYSDSITANFGSMDAAFRTLQYFISYEVTKVDPLFFVVTLLLALLFMMFGRFARLSDRHAAAGVALGILGMLAFLFFLESVPIRVSAFLAGPLAFLAMVMSGSLLAARCLLPVRPLVLAGFSGVAGVVLWNAGIDEPLIPRQNWEGFARLIGQAFPQDARLWVTGKYGKLMRWYLPERKIEEDDLDSEALASGQLLVFDSAFKGGSERDRFTWETLPKGVRYVTSPLLVNYQRLYFVPPAERNISGVTVDGRPIAGRFVGPQPLDPATLSYSAGDGDALYKGEQPLEGTPDVISLPSVLQIDLAPSAPQGGWRGACNLLFSQTLEDKIVTAEVQDAEGKWNEARLFVMGEMASVPLEFAGSRAVRLHLAPDPGYRLGPKNSGRVRPAFWLVDAWTAL